MEGLGLKLENLREKAGYTQQEMSFKLGFSKNTFGKYEREDIDPSLVTLVRIADFFQVPIEMLLRDKEPAYLKNYHDVKEILDLLEEAGLKTPFLTDVNSWSLLGKKELQDLHEYFYRQVQQAAKKED
ncbi:helix-turn-helix domain-containing protein [Oceanobacillus manasiensis]|uniref:helix-turn-helix domain-containing protein n=1 Tax=Oceanobacillus manasiensis TaxID=586413 RepID=UPI0005A71857|nr:helix-turn-helix transcriptional regulator [Oceanobacillus manasiensis]